ncbi:MAG: class II glutamine amidotransferase [Clostridiales Family XIII bacterium]|nr:class II glutamine amidotransferase [Clostridiales Family XIII bacterium]
MVTSRSGVEVGEEVKKFFESSYVHQHGWGWAEFAGGGISSFRETKPAHESKYLRDMLAAPLVVRDAFFHVRYATVGAVEFLNTHPLFARDDSGRRWAIVHNGTIFNGDLTDRFFHEQDGDSDTERLLLYIVGLVNQAAARAGAPLGSGERFRVVDGALRDVAKGNKLNVIISDSEMFYVHGNSPHGAKLLGAYGADDYIYELALGAGGQVLGSGAGSGGRADSKGAGGGTAGSGEVATRIFSTVPLDGRAWRPIRMNTVFAYKGGRLMFQGEPHGYGYVESEDDMKRLYQGFSGL